MSVKREDGPSLTEAMVNDRWRVFSTSKHLQKSRLNDRCPGETVPLT